MTQGPHARNATIAKQNKITSARVYQIVRNANSDVIKRDDRK
jgi:hypothetical protein